MKVFYVSGYATDVFYVHAETAEAAKTLLLDEVGKYIFRRNLKDEEGMQIPETLGDNIIVEFGVHRDLLDADLVVEDITATAYIFAQNELPHWEKWNIEIKDVVGNAQIAESIQEILNQAGTEEGNV